MHSVEISGRGPEHPASGLDLLAGLLAVPAAPAARVLRNPDWQRALRAAGLESVRTPHLRQVRQVGRLQEGHRGAEDEHVRAAAARRARLQAQITE